MQSSREDHIRHRAHEIWEREGRPEGRHEVHWVQACAEIGTKRANRTKPAAGPVAKPGHDEKVDALPAAKKPKSKRLLVPARAPKGKPVREASMTVVTSKERSKAVWTPADIKLEKATSSTKAWKAAEQTASEKQQ